MADCSLPYLLVGMMREGRDLKNAEKCDLSSSIAADVPPSRGA